MIAYRWDLDKTYLSTEFDTFRDLIRTAFEPADQKKTIPGAARLIRELRATDPVGIFILSGTPEQMRKVIERKLTLDGVQWDSLTLKPSLRNILKGRFYFVRDQVGYKLGALIESRLQLAAQVDEIMFGDDAETDALIYSIYSDLCAGRVHLDMVQQVLAHARVHPSEISRIVDLAKALPSHDVGRRIFIHLDRMTEPSAFLPFGRRVCPFYNYFQPAVALVEDGLLSAHAALQVASDLLEQHGFGVRELRASFVDMVRREQVGRASAKRLVAARHEVDETTFPHSWPVLQTLLDELSLALDGIAELEPLQALPIDYISTFQRDLDRVHLAKQKAIERLRAMRLQQKK
jgi:hypothetical protein